MSGDDETPWALVQRLRAEGAPFSDIVERLKARGLDRESLELLLKDAPELRAAPPPPRPRPKPSAGDPVMDAAAEALSLAPGKPLRWIAIVLLAAALVAGLGGWSAALEWGPFTAGAAVLPLVALVFVELRHGPRRALRLIAFTLFITCTLPGFSGFFAGWHAFQVGCATAALGAIPLFLWATRAAELLPGLSDFGGGEHLFESRDVHFVVSFPERSRCAPGEAVRVVVLAQSCVDVARDLVVEVGGDVTGLVGPHRHSFRLPPGAVMRITVPLRLTALPPPRLNLTLDVQGEGPEAGRRVKLARGEPWSLTAGDVLENAMSLWDVMNGSFALFTVRANGNLRVDCDVTLPFVARERQPVTQTLFEPSPEQLDRAARS